MTIMAMTITAVRLIMVELIVFVISAAIILTGAIGVIAARNPVHSALMLVMTLFGVAVMFVAQEAHFLAAVQIIVYAGAIVILFLFVIMLLGVDRAEELDVGRLTAQRPMALLAGAGVLASVLVSLLAGDESITGAREVGRGFVEGEADFRQIGRLLFTDYVLAFELTAILLTIAVVGAVMLARRVRGEAIDGDTYLPEQARRRQIRETPVLFRTPVETPVEESVNAGGGD